MRFVSQLLACALLGLLCACQAAPENRTQAAACSVERVTELPVRFYRGLVLVPGTVDNNPVSLMIDTASQKSLVNAEILARLRLDRDVRSRTTLRGVGGEITTTNVRLTSFAVGEMEMLDQSMAVGPMPGAPGLDPPIGGLLGTDFLSSFELDLDLPSQKITLYRMQACPDGAVPSPHPGAAIPLRRLSTTFLAIEIQIDGHPLAALVDSGARQSTINRAAARDIGVSDEMLARDPPTSAFGVDQLQITGHIHRFHDLRIGGEDLREQPLEVAGVHISGADVLLGADFLRSRHIWLSYAHHVMFLAPAGS